MMIQEAHFKIFYNLVKIVSVHHKNIQILTTEVSKIVNDIYPPIMKIFFSFKEKQIQPQKFQRNKRAKYKNYLIWYRNSTLPRLATTFP